MTRPRWRSLLITTLFLLGALVLFATHAPLRTSAYILFGRTWHAHWHFSFASAFPIRLRPLVKPVKTWYAPEPGMTMLLDPFDAVAYTILVSGKWEPEAFEAIGRSLPSGGTLIDVGAHIGYCSLKAAKMAGPRGRVIAIEPNPEILPVLRGNIAANNASTIVAEPVACSNAEGTVELFAANEINTGSSSLSSDNASIVGEIDGAYHVRARTLDSIVAGHALARVDVIKIDVEGAEMLVLQGARETLAKYRPAIVIEFRDELLGGMGTSEAAIRSLLHAAGYVPGARLGEDDYEFLPVRQ